MSNLPDERRGDVAALLAQHQWREFGPACSCGWDWDARAWCKTIDTAATPLWTAQIAPARHAAYEAHVADALAPMLAGWLAEERRDLAAKVEALADSWAAIPPYTASNYDLGRVEQREMCETELRTLLADALPQDADSEPASVPVSARGGGNGQDHAGEGERAAGRLSEPPEVVECCASGRCEVCTPGYDWGRDG